MGIARNVLYLARAALVAGFLLLALSGAAALWSIGSLRGALERQDRAQALIDAAGVAIHDLHELEIEHLRFVANGQDANRGAMAQDVKNLRASIEVLDRGLDESARSRSMPELRRAVEAYLAQVEAAARARRERGRDAVLGELAGPAWGERFEAIEETIKKLKATTVAVAQAESAAIEVFGRRVTAWALGGGASATFCLILAVVLMRQTRRERASFERRLRDGEQKFRALLESAPDAMVVVGGTGEIQLVNAQAERLFGYARAELLGQSVEMLVPERQRLAHIGHRGGFLAQPRARVMGSRMDLRARRKDGSEFPTEISLSPVEGGNEVMIIGAIRDITEQKHAEETARARERFIRTITDNIPAAVTYVDREERYRFVNKAYADWLGMAKESIEGHTVREIIGERAYAALGPTVLARAFAGETVRYERTQPVPAGGPRELAVTLIPDGDAQSGVIGQYAFIEDVTESKRLARLKNEFISTVSHELRTPLTSIRGSLGLLDGGVAGALGGRAKNLVALARQNCDRLIRLINDILDMEKIEAGKMVFVMKPVALMELIEEAIAANEGYAQAHDTRFVVTAALADARVRGDRDRLMQVLTNLLSNAAKFSPPGASVDIAVERRGEGIRVSVIDHGPGISKEFQERIFEKFSQADSSDARKKGGSGLGLAISKAIVEKHAGELAFTTRKGEGTTFYFELPELSERAERGAPPRPDSKPDRVLVYTNEREAGRRLADAVTQAGFLTDVSDNKEDAERLFGSRKYVAVALTGAEADLLRDVLVEPASERKPSILHVEDDADMRQVIAAHLDRFGKVNGAATLAEARERLAREHYDLLLLDIGLPDGSAWSLVEELQAQPSWPRIVVFSAEAVAPERRARVDAALQKSRDSEVRLVETVKSVLAQGEVRKG